MLWYPYVAAEADELEAFVERLRVVRRSAIVPVLGSRLKERGDWRVLICDVSNNNKGQWWVTGQGLASSSYLQAGASVLYWEAVFSAKAAHGAIENAPSTGGVW